MEFFLGLGVVGSILLIWGTLSVCIAVVIWTCLVASKGLWTTAGKHTPSATNLTFMKRAHGHGQLHRSSPLTLELGPDASLSQWLA